MAKEIFILLELILTSLWTVGPDWYADSDLLTYLATKPSTSAKRL
jgi:hypothetical protein